ncbi:MAG: haloacid dehalogenase [Sediminibacterium sp.]|nr:haloacid dehalogenase [Sediminibacterium sp.]
MPPLIKALVFDLDGVIIDSNPVIETFWKSWADRNNILLTDALVREWIHGRKVGDTISGIFAHLPVIQQEEIQKAGLEFDSLMNPEAIQGVREFIGALTALNISAGVVTSSHHSRMLKMLSHLGIEGQFTHFVTAFDVTRGKPHPEPYAKMHEKMNLLSTECLVFEDAISGVQSAVAAGMHVIGIGNEAARDALMFQGAADVVRDFTQLHINATELSTVNGIRFRLE